MALYIAIRPVAFVDGSFFREVVAETLGEAVEHAFAEVVDAHVATAEQCSNRDCAIVVDEGGETAGYLVGPEHE